MATRRRGLNDSATAAGKAQSTAGGPKLLLTCPPSLFRRTGLHFHHARVRVSCLLPRTIRGCLSTCSTNSTCGCQPRRMMQPPKQHVCSPSWRLAAFSSAARRSFLRSLILYFRCRGNQTEGETSSISHIAVTILLLRTIIIIII